MDSGPRRLLTTVTLIMNFFVFFLGIFIYTIWAALDDQVLGTELGISQRREGRKGKERLLEHWLLTFCFAFFSCTNLG